MTIFGGYKNIQQLAVACNEQGYILILCSPAVEDFAHRQTFLNARLKSSVDVTMMG